MSEAHNQSREKNIVSSSLSWKQLRAITETISLGLFSLFLIIFEELHTYNLSWQGLGMHVV